MDTQRRQASPTPNAGEIADRLHAAAIHLLRRLRAEDTVAGLSAPRLSALSVAVYAGPITMTELAAAEQVRPPTISRMVKELEREGLVKRISDPNDERVQRVTATRKGRRVLEMGRRRRVAALTAEVARLPSRDRRVLARAAELLRRFALPPNTLRNATRDDR